MSNVNSFNVCSRCGSANSLSAKYCYQCGSQLKVPEEPIVCPKCHSVNSSMANFCRTCGSTLKVGAKTKICPRCKKEVAVSQQQCSCGYAFATVIQNSAADSTKSQRHKGGRWIALLSVIFTALFALALTIPFAFMQNFVTTSNLYALATSSEGALVGLGVVDIFNIMMQTVNTFLTTKVLVVDSLLVMLVLFAVTLVTMGIHLICAFVRLLHGKRGKSVNVFYLIMALLTGALSALFIVANTSPTGVAFVDFFAMNAPYSIGWGILIIPAYYLFFFVFSLFAKRKKQA